MKTNANNMQIHFSFANIFCTYKVRHSLIIKEKPFQFSIPSAIIVHVHSRASMSPFQSSLWSWWYCPLSNFSSQNMLIILYLPYCYYPYCWCKSMNLMLLTQKSKVNGQNIRIKNKRPMGHIAHLRKQFKSINTYDYIITLIKRRKKI